MNWQSFLDALSRIDPEAARAIGAVLAGILGGGALTILGARKGKPTTAAVAAAVERAALVCKADMLAPAITTIREQVAAIEKTQHSQTEEMESLRDMLVRIEDRTRR